MSVFSPAIVPLRCPRASGRLGGHSLGRLRLRMTRAQTGHALTDSSDRGKRYQQFFCLTPNGVRVGYASPKLLRTFADSDRRLFAGRVVWISTASTYYSRTESVRAPSVTVASKYLRLESRFTSAATTGIWHRGRRSPPYSKSAAEVQEIGIADRQLTQTRSAQRTFITSFS